MVCILILLAIFCKQELQPKVKCPMEDEIRDRVEFGDDRPGPRPEPEVRKKFFRYEVGTSNFFGEKTLIDTLTRRRERFTEFEHEAYEKLEQQRTFGEATDLEGKEIYKVEFLDVDKEDMTLIGPTPEEIITVGGRWKRVNMHILYQGPIISEFVRVPTEEEVKAISEKQAKEEAYKQLKKEHGKQP